jgi:hypothetical protein
MKNLVVFKERWGHRDIECNVLEQEDGVVALAAGHDSGDTYFATRKGSIYGKAASGEVSAIHPTVGAGCIAVGIVELF